MSEVLSEVVTYVDPPAGDAVESDRSIVELASFIDPDPTSTLVSDRTIAERVEMVSTALSEFPEQLVVQKVWDTVEGNWVLWETNAMDIDGSEYPGPGTWGANTSDYRVLNIKFTRVQG